MRIVSLILLATILAVATANTGDKVGVKVTVSEAALGYLKDQMMPVAEAKALAAQIGDMEARASVPVVGKVDMKIRDMKLNRLHVSNSTIELIAPDTLAVGFTGLDLDVTLRWHYREVKWPHVADSGRGEGKTTRASGRVVFAIGTDAQGRPTAKIRECGLGLKDLSLKLHGGASWLYNAVISLFHGKIVRAIDGAVCGALTGDVQALLDKMLAQIPVQEPLGRYFAIDYSLANPGGIVMTAAHELVASSQGEFYPQGGSPGKAPGAPAAMPDSVARAMFQIFISSFSAQSLGYVAASQGLVRRDFTKDQAPLMAQAFFTTDFYAQYAPGLVAKYGAGQEVELHFEMHSTPSVAFSARDKAIVRAGVEMTVRARPAAGAAFEDAFTVLLMATCVGSAKVENTVISGELADANATASLVQSQVGDVDLNGFNDLITFALSMATTAVNEILAKGAPLPSMQGLDFVNPTVLYRDGYIVVTTDIKFTPPPF